MSDICLYQLIFICYYPVDIFVCFVRSYKFLPSLMLETKYVLMSKTRITVLFNSLMSIRTRNIQPYTYMQTIYIFQITCILKYIFIETRLRTRQCPLPIGIVHMHKLRLSRMSGGSIKSYTCIRIRTFPGDVEKSSV